MTILYPDYKDRFRCLAGACPDSCCKAWEIVVNPDTAAFYRTVPGAMGERLRQCLAVDDEGDDYFPLVNGRCPFLNRAGLCDIHAALGESATGAVCRQFPDFVEEYEGFTERCPSPACPAAAELIFAEPLTDDVYPVPPASEDEWLNLLAKGRAAALHTAAVCDTFAEGAARIWAMAQELQEIGDGFDPRSAAYNPSDAAAGDAWPDGTDAFAQWMTALTERCLRFLQTDAELLTAEWRSLLKTARNADGGIDGASRAAGENAADEQQAVKRAMRYFLYRYFLKPVNDGDVLLWTAFVLVSVAVCVRIARCTQTDLCAVVRLYAKEIEHDAENVDAMLDVLAERIPLRGLSKPS